MAKKPDGEGDTKQVATLSLQRVAIDTYRESVTYLHRQCEIYRAEGFQALARVEVGNKERRILAVLNVVDDQTLVAPSELGLSEEDFERLGLEAGSAVRVQHAGPPQSIEAVGRKIEG